MDHAMNDSTSQNVSFVRRLTRRKALQNAFLIAAGVTAVPLASLAVSCQKISKEKTPQNGHLNEADSYFILKERISCINCGYCMPCPFGIDIPGIFQFIASHAAIDPLQTSEMAFSDNVSSNAVVETYDHAIPELRQADKCTECRRCVSLCPERISIPDKMFLIAKTIESKR